MSSSAASLPAALCVPEAGVGMAARGDGARTWIRPRYAGFDGLRGLAVLAVTLHHTPIGPWRAVQSGMGWMGVDLFFVLSGFLITGILFDSLEVEERRGYFRNFYARRALRIFPIFYLAFAALLVATPLLHLRWSGWTWSYLAYGGNLVVPFVDLARQNPTQVLMQVRGHWMPVCDLGPLWSLCVEEQFYLLWPGVVWLVRDRAKLMRLCVVVFVAAPVWRTVLYLAAPARAIAGYGLLWSSFTRCDTLLVGAWLALWLRGEQLSAARLKRLGWALVLGAGALLVPSTWQLVEGSRGWVAGTVGAASTHPATNPFTVTVGLSLIALVCAGVLLLALDESSWVGRVLQVRWLAGVGAISYGVYLYAGWLGGDWGWARVVSPRLAEHRNALHLALTLSVAWASFRWVERPLLRWKERFGGAGTRAAQGVGVGSRAGAALDAEIESVA